MRRMRAVALMQSADPGLRASSGPQLPGAAQRRGRAAGNGEAVGAEAPEPGLGDVRRAESGHGAGAGCCDAVGVGSRAARAHRCRGAGRQDLINDNELFNRVKDEPQAIDVGDGCIRFHVRPGRPPRRWGAA